MEIQEKINALMEKEEFVEAFKKTTTPEEVVELFGQNGIDIPHEIADELFQVQTYQTDDLSEEDLEAVAGGGPVGAMVGKAIGKAVYYGAGYLGGRLAGWSKSQSKSYANKCGKVGSVIGGAIGGLL